MKKKVIGAVLILGSLVFGAESLERFQRTNDHLAKTGIRSTRAAIQTGYIEKLDSVISLYSSGDSTKEHMLFNSLGQIIERHRYNRIENEWFEVEKREFRYDQLGNTIEETGSEWKEASNAMELAWKTEYLYDGSGNQISRIDYNRTNNEWVGNIKEIQTFDAQNRVFTWSSYGFVNDRWYANYKSEFTYDHSGRDSVRINYDFDTMLWKEYNKLVYEYSLDGTFETMTAFQNRLDTWELSYRRTTEYNSAGKEMSSAFYYFTLDGAPSPESRTEYLYDEKGNMVETKTTRYESSAPIPSGREIFTYDISKQNTLIALGYWRETMEYLCAGSVLMATHRSEWNETKQAYEPSSQTTFYYSPVDETAIIPQALTSSAAIQIAQCGAVLTLSGALPTGTSLALYDLSGRMVVSGDVTGSSFAIPNLAKGIYAVEILAGKHSVVQKVVVR